jgi:hypothetical protein
MTAREKSRHRTARYSAQIVQDESTSEYFTLASRYIVHTFRYCHLYIILILATHFMLSRFYNNFYKIYKFYCILWSTI